MTLALKIQKMEYVILVILMQEQVYYIIINRPVARVENQKNYSKFFIF